MSGTVMTNGGQHTPQGAIVEMLRALEEGNKLTRFDRRRPENRMFRVKLETRQLMWSRNIGVGCRPEGIVDLRDVQEIRLGKNSRDFERWKDDSSIRYDSTLCFVLQYGKDFRLKTLSLAASNNKEYEMWIAGLRFLVDDMKHSSYTLQMERWLRKEFYTITKDSNNVREKDVKSWLPKINYKLPTAALREKYQELGGVELNFEMFRELFSNLIFEDKEFGKHFQMYLSSRDKMTLEDFQQFLIHQQNETKAKDMNWVKQHMSSFLEDPPREAVGLYFTRPEFLDYLFSEHNSVWNEDHNSVTQNMDYPLSFYWIASSHNTYLMGDQFSSESSVEAYVRALKKGCRCIELDCWDGPDFKPIITHGHTMTSKINFIDVLKAIAANAFEATEYPLILSIENHCSILQQRNMATAFKDTFGDMLLTELIDPSATMLPSPNQLRKKIILKHKKWTADGASEKVSVSSDDSNQTDTDLSNSVKNGILFLEDPVDKEWRPHFFVLMPTKLSYTEETHLNEQDEEEEEGNNLVNAINEQQNRPESELHYGETWFHGKMPEGRLKAIQLLKEYSYLGDGTHLVRESETFVGDFSLSFWRRGSDHHCRIRSTQEMGQTKYYLTNNRLFDSLYSLINHHREHPLKSADFEQKLKEPVPQPQSHEDKEWYHHELSRERAEEMLCRVPYNGAFLVRKKKKVPTATLR